MRRKKRILERLARMIVCEIRAGLPSDKYIEGRTIYLMLYNRTVHVVIMCIYACLRVPVEHLHACAILCISYIIRITRSSCAISLVSFNSYSLYAIFTKLHVRSAHIGVDNRQNIASINTAMPVIKS